jgi:hypothetical protein
VETATKGGKKADNLLAKHVDPPHPVGLLCMILDAVDEPAPGASSYRRVITVIQWTIFALFLLGALYAIRLSLI